MLSSVKVRVILEACQGAIIHSQVAPLEYPARPEPSERVPFEEVSKPHIDSHPEHSKLACIRHIISGASRQKWRRMRTCLEASLYQGASGLSKFCGVIIFCICWCVITPQLSRCHYTTTSVSKVKIACGYYGYYEHCSDVPRSTML